MAVDLTDKEVLKAQDKEGSVSLDFDSTNILKISHTYYRYTAKEGAVRVSLSLDKKKWLMSKEKVLEPRPGCFDAGALNVAGAFGVTNFILLVYFTVRPLNIGVALFSKKDPAKVLWRTERAVWSTGEDLSFLSVKKETSDIVIKLVSKDGEVVKLVLHLKTLIEKVKIHPDFGTASVRPALKRHSANPIIVPNPANDWESSATFNPAAFSDGDKIHIVYRAVGNDNVSVLGYANTKDGFNIDERLSCPIYLPREPFEGTLHPKSGEVVTHYSSGGGGYGGCEDPRLTLIENRVYLTYTAFDGWGSIRTAMTSISLDDFLNKNWNWDKSAIISPPGEIHKNWVLFPEKIDGKYAILHSISPTVKVEYLDDLEALKDDATFINSTFGGKANRDRFWDNWLRGAGPPPLRTNLGWLLLYHAMDKRDPNRYKIGAMILDYKDPTKILYRARRPVLEPIAHYENEGFKSGVVYACGAAIKDEKLMVYYGGADMVTCAAHYNLNAFLREVKANSI